MQFSPRSYEYSNEISGSIKRGEFPDQLSVYEIFKKNFTSRSQELATRPCVEPEVSFTE
jgi:hypothetical protein